MRGGGGDEGSRIEPVIRSALGGGEVNGATDVIGPAGTDSCTAGDGKRLGNTR